MPRYVGSKTESATNSRVLQKHPWKGRVLQLKGGNLRLETRSRTLRRRSIPDFKAAPRPKNIPEIELSPLPQADTPTEHKKLETIPEGQPVDHRTPSMEQGDSTSVVAKTAGAGRGRCWAEAPCFIPKRLVKYGKFNPGAAEFVPGMPYITNV